MQWVLKYLVQRWSKLLYSYFPMDIFFGLLKIWVRISLLSCMCVCLLQFVYNYQQVTFKLWPQCITLQSCELAHMLPNSMFLKIILLEEIFFLLSSRRACYSAALLQVMYCSVIFLNIHSRNSNIFSFH